MIKNKGLSKNLFAKSVPGVVEILQKKTVGIAGLGGLGSNVAVSLARAGIGRLILVDYDKVEESNLNRQHYFQSDIGKLKTEAIRFYLEGINPDIKLVIHNKKMDRDDVSVFFGDADLLIEAFDSVESKKWLIDSWSKSFSSRPIVCGSGMSGLGDFSDLRVENAGDIYFCGDQHTEASEGFLSSRVAIVANMQALVGVRHLCNNG